MVRKHSSQLTPRAGALPAAGLQIQGPLECRAGVLAVLTAAAVGAGLSAEAAPTRSDLLVASLAWFH